MKHTITRLKFLSLHFTPAHLRMGMLLISLVVMVLGGSAPEAGGETGA